MTQVTLLLVIDVHARAYGGKGEICHLRHRARVERVQPDLLGNAPLIARRPAMRASAALPIEAAIERTSGIAHDVAGGLDRLATSPPLWPVDGTAWLGMVERVRTFACQWGARERAAGWSPLEISTVCTGARRTPTWPAWAGRSWWCGVVITSSTLPLMRSRFDRRPARSCGSYRCRPRGANGAGLVAPVK